MSDMIASASGIGYEKPPRVELAAAPVAEWLNREQAAAYIYAKTGVPVTVGVLANRASKGDGPAYRIWRGRGVARGGRGRFAVYRPADIDTWIALQIHSPLAPESAD